jgi:hypothetical protein
MVALGFKDLGSAFSNLGPRRVPRRPDAGDRLPLGRFKAAGFVVLLRVLEPFFMLPQMQRLLVALAAFTHDLRQSRRLTPEQPEATACLLEYRTPGDTY